MKTIRLLLKIYRSGAKFVVTGPFEFRQGVRNQNSDPSYWAAGLIRHVNKFGDLRCPLQVICEYDGPWGRAQQRIISAADNRDGGLMRWLLLKAARVNA